MDKSRAKFSKGRITGPGVDPRVDTLLGMVMALTSEVSVLRERLDAHEKLAQQGKAADTESVDAYLPSEPEEVHRATLRNRLIEKVCRPLGAADADAES